MRRSYAWLRNESKCVGNEVVPNLRIHLHRKWKTEQARSEFRDTCCTKILKTLCILLGSLSPSFLKNGDSTCFWTECVPLIRTPGAFQGEQSNWHFKNRLWLPVTHPHIRKSWMVPNGEFPIHPTFQTKCSVQNYESFQPIHFLQLDIFLVTMPWCKLC